MGLRIGGWGAPVVHIMKLFCVKRKVKLSEKVERFLPEDNLFSFLLEMLKSNIYGRPHFKLRGVGTSAEGKVQFGINTSTVSKKKSVALKEGR